MYNNNLGNLVETIINNEIDLLQYNLDDIGMITKSINKIQKRINNIYIYIYIMHIYNIIMVIIVIMIMIMIKKINNK